MVGHLQYPDSKMSNAPLKDRTHDATLRAANIARNVAGVEASSTSEHFTQQLHHVSTPLHAMLHTMLHRVSGP